MVCIPPPPVEVYNSRLTFEPSIIIDLNYNSSTVLTRANPVVHYIPFIDNGEMLSKYNDSFISNMKYLAISKKLSKPNITILVFSSYLHKIFLKNGVKIKSVAPILDGGVEFEFNHNNNFYNITLTNEDEASFYVERLNEIPEGWDLDFPNLKAKIEKEFC